MIKVEVYLYDSTQEENDYRGVDYSSHVLQGNELTENITQEMDVSEITLAGLNFREEFAPGTKFVINIKDTDSFADPISIHRIVSRDTVNQPILSDNNYFDHHISLIEPSVDAQKRLVDNISTTYKLKDVTLEEQVIYPTSSAYTKFKESQFTPTYNFGLTTEKEGNIFVGSEKSIYFVGKYFKKEGNVLLYNKDGQSFNTIYNDLANFLDEDDNKYYARFSIPRIAMYIGKENTKTFTKGGYASIDYVIYEYPLTSNTPTVVDSGTFISNSNLSSTAHTIQPNELRSEWVLEVADKFPKLFGDILVYVQRKYYRKYTSISAPTLTSSDYFSNLIEIKQDKRYYVEISLHTFSDNLPLAESTENYKYYSGSNPTNYYRFIDTKGTGIFNSGETHDLSENKKYMTTEQTTLSSEFITYNINSEKIMYASARPYSALALLQKAIINSSVYEKKDGVYIADVNNSDLPYYIDEDFIDELDATVIVENFYNQKNLWEIMVEVGNYIHAIPELRFGQDNKLMITFNRLGRTDQKQDNGTKTSIYSTRSIEDYVSAVSSYVTNMVQLGGVIEERVAPKTNDEQYLVANDTAQIIVTKPIIELIEVKAIRNSDGAVADITEYLYEENVYKTLEPNYKVSPNRGLAMYYKLGTNVITGGQYRLPQANENIYSDYTFKKIIYTAFYSYPVIPVGQIIPTSGYWTDLKINDYTFIVKYRTKDDVRQSHVRPDLRKYLLSTPYDKYPEYNQFNNQTDVVVDSIKFGNNMYGKLIRTGNSTYEEVEWHNNLNDIKHKGELYMVNGELYYVAKITHTFYSTHIISNVTFSKDYNELSKVIGIPSEPRFYEISEQSLIRRDFAINDLLLLTDKEEQIQYGSNYVRTFDHLADLMLSSGTEFAKYAITVYKGDKDTNTYSQTAGEPYLYKEVLTPVNAYSSEGTLTYEWDMLDNYSAGDKVIATDESEYNSLRAVQYTDIYGRASLMDFYILGDIGSLTTSEIKALPESPIGTKLDSQSPVTDYNILATNVKAFDENYNGRGIGLLKDCRESISLNYNLQLITSSDTFVVSPYVFSPSKKNLKVVLLSDEVNKLSTGYISNGLIITPMDTDGNEMNPYFDLEVTKFNDNDIVSKFSVDLSSIFENVDPRHFTGDENFTQVKSIAILCDVSFDSSATGDVSVIPYKTQFIIARNIPTTWDKETALKTWYFGAPNKDNVFVNKQ